MHESMLGRDKNNVEKLNKYRKIENYVRETIW